MEYMSGPSTVRLTVLRHGKAERQRVKADWQQVNSETRHARSHTQTMAY